MKKALKIAGIVLLSLVLLMVAAVLILPRLGLPEGEVSIDVGDVDLTYVENGTYSGNYSAGLVSAAVTVDVADYAITGIRIDEHKNGLGKKAEKITDDVLAAQSLDVDAVSGATISSQTILKAIECALISDNV